VKDYKSAQDDPEYSPVPKMPRKSNSVAKDEGGHDSEPKPFCDRFVRQLGLSVINSAQDRRDSDEDANYAIQKQIFKLHLSDSWPRAAFLTAAIGERIALLRFFLLTVSYRVWSTMPGMKHRIGLVALASLVLVLSWTALCASQTTQPEGAQQFAELGDFRLQNGSIIHDFNLGYRTLGKLNAQKSNAILWPSWLGGKAEDLLQFLGPGKVVDTSHYFVILVDAIGNGVSTSPSNSKSQALMKFPEFTIRDMVESEHRLVTDVLHLSHLRAVMGLSMGGMQTIEWGVTYPDFMDLLIPMAGSPQSTSFDKLLWTAQIDAIELDPAWNHGNPTGPLDRGLGLVEEIGSMNLTSPAYRVAQTKPEGFNALLAEIRKSARGDGGAASDRIRQRQAIIRLDIPGELGVTLEQSATRVHAKLLVIVSPQDHLVNPEPAIQFAAAAGAALLKLDSPCGHLSLACISVGPTVARFLADPGSVHSETLTEPVKH
jgi:homoserine O-acetyltransferase/O-succinyltransferase